MRIRWFETTRRQRRNETGQQLLSKLVDLFFDLLLVDLFFFEVELEFEAFYFNFSFALVFENGLVWLSVLWGSRVPGGLVIIPLMNTKGRQIANNIAASSTAAGRCKADSVVHDGG